MGHNGGFNPFRDQNGEFTTPEGSGKPGRARKGGSGGSTAARRAATPKGIQQATAVGQGIPNPGIDYRDRKGTRQPSEGAQIRAGEVKSSQAATLGRIGPQAMENEWRIERGLAPLKPNAPRTRVRQPKK